MLLGLIITPRAMACDCISQGEFLTVAPKAKLVALVRVVDYLSYKDIYDEKMPMSMQVEIVDIYKGHEPRKTITVWGDNGALCRPYLNQFKIGDYYIIAFEQAGSSSTGDEKPTDFAISNCGDYWLNADTTSKKAHGSVTKTETIISFEELRRKLSVK